MKLTTKSEYALVCLKYICEHSLGRPVSVSKISEKERFPKDYVEQIFVSLRKAGIVKSVKGIYGGFVLAREPSQITVKDVIHAVEGRTFETFCAPRLRERIICGHASACSVRPMWRKLKQLIDDFCDRVTLSMLLGEERLLENQFELSPVETNAVKQEG